jgi:hypothetical protein
MHMPFNSRTALAVRNRLGGLHRAAFWRELGFPNLVLARAAKAKKREQRLRLERVQPAKRFSPFAMMDDLSAYDDLSLGHPERRDGRRRRASVDVSAKPSASPARARPNM